MTEISVGPDHRALSWCAHRVCLDHYTLAQHDTRLDLDRLDARRPRGIFVPTRPPGPGPRMHVQHACRMASRRGRALTCDATRYDAGEVLEWQAGGLGTYLHSFPYTCTLRKIVYWDGHGWGGARINQGGCASPKFRRRSRGVADS